MANRSAEPGSAMVERCATLNSMGAASEIGGADFGAGAGFFDPQPSTSAIKHDVMISLAGQVAQQRYHPDPTCFRSWADLLKSYQVLDGDLDLLFQYQREVEILIDGHLGEVESIASALLENGSLTGEQVTDVLSLTQGISK